MKLAVHLVLTLLFVVVPLEAAQQEKFDEITAAIRQADQLIEEGKDRQGIAQYQLAQKRLLQFQETNPNWDKQLVAFRLRYLSDKLEGWVGGSSTTPDSASSESKDSLRNRINYLERVNGQYQFQLKQLHAENARLNTKLREALALRPAAQEPAAIADTQARLINAESELGEAKKRIAQLEQKLAEYPEPEEAKQNVQILVETRKNLNQVIAEAEELRSINEMLRTGAATQRVPVRVGAETLHKQVVAAQAALQLAESEVIRLRQENGNLNTRLASLEARFDTARIDGGGSAIPRLSKADSARMAMARGDHAGAAKLLAEALKDSPNDVEVLYLLGRSLMLQDKPAEAELRLKKVLELSPESGVTHFELARLYYSLDQANPGLARWHYHKALNLGFPRNADFEKGIRWEQPGG